MTKSVSNPLLHFLIASALVALIGCADEPTARRRTQQEQLVVLSLTDLTGGAIAGFVACRDKDGRSLMDEPCLPDATTLARAVLLCGPLQLGIDMSSSHVSYVHFPSQLRDMPPDIEVVKCIQRRIGFRFSAAISSFPPSHPDAKFDDQPFRRMHTKDTSQPLRP